MIFADLCFFSSLHCRIGFAQAYEEAVEEEYYDEEVIEDLVSYALR